MILRRIAHQLKQQYWGAVLIELAIVELGVFHGFQVTARANERSCCWATSTGTSARVANWPGHP
jgi:hypothetical protein